MKSIQKSTRITGASVTLRSNHPRSASASGLAETISKKLLEIKRISGEGEMTELNMALFRHLK
jgi:hypothetical protein